MLLFSFDCATINLGVCCAQCYDKKTFSDNINKLCSDGTDLIKELRLIKEMKSCDKNSQIIDYLIKLNDFLDNYIKIVFINTINLLPRKKLNSDTFQLVANRLKYFLTCLDEQLGTPDIVIIENQWNVNDKSKAIARYITDHYTQIDTTDIELEYSIEQFPLVVKEFPPRKTSIFTIFPSVKLTCQLDKSEEFTYNKFRIKYYNSYEANKAFAKHHFNHYLSVMKLPYRCKKMDDISDAFLQLFGWLFQKLSE